MLNLHIFARAGTSGCKSLQAFLRHGPWGKNGDICGWHVGTASHHHIAISMGKSGIAVRWIGSKIPMPRILPTFRCLWHRDTPWHLTSPSKCRGQCFSALPCDRGVVRLWWCSALCNRNVSCQCQTQMPCCDSTICTAVRQSGSQAVSIKSEILFVKTSAAPDNTDPMAMPLWSRLTQRFFSKL